MTQAELAERLGISNKTISSWEVNRTEPSMVDVEKMANIFGCTKSAIIGLPDEIINGSEDARLLAKINRLTSDKRQLLERMIDTWL